MPPQQREAASSTATGATLLALLITQYATARQAATEALQNAQQATLWQFLATAGAITQALAAGRAGQRLLTPEMLRAANGPRDRAALGQAAVDALYDESAVTALARLWGNQSSAARTQAALQSAAFQARALQLMGVPASPQRVTLPPAPRGVPDDEVYQRPVEQARYIRSTGGDLDDALDALERRLASVSEADVRLAEREGARQQLQRQAQVSGYRRVLRPELSRTGTCGLCIVASDRWYSYEELLPIHDECKCIVIPVIGPRNNPISDPGRALNDSDLARLYEAAGGNEAARLKRVRIQVTEHGELGPILSAAGTSTKDPDEVRRQSRADRLESPQDKARRLLEFTEQQVALLQARVDAGETKYAPTLAWQRQLLAERRAAV